MPCTARPYWLGGFVVSFASFGRCTIGRNIERGARMNDGAIYRAGWALDDVDWSRFDASKVDKDLLAAVKAATLDAIAHWGSEEVQHGRALARWAELADPTYDFEDAFARFRKLYRPAHFD